MEPNYERQSEAQDAAVYLHAVMFPFPVMSHVNPMLHLAKLLVGEGFLVTFVNTEHIHKTMFGLATGGDLGTDDGLGGGGRRLRFAQIPDGLPEGHGRFEEDPVEMLSAVLNMEPRLVRLLESDMFEEMGSRKNGGAVDGSIISRDSDGMWPPPTCIIADTFCSWVQNVADRFGIPRVALWTTAIHANLAFLAHKPGEKVTTMTTVTALSGIPGVPQLSPEDDISFFRVHPHHHLYQFFVWFAMKRVGEAAWNLGNNVSEMETETWQEMARQVPNFLAMGPLFERPRVTNMESEEKEEEEEEEYMRWLDGRGEGEVVYVSFGSFVKVGEEDMAAVAEAVEASGAAFLWAGRIGGGRAEAVVEGMVSKGQGLKMGWVAQRRVLAHPSVGAFLSHCGWNSILESATFGVPLIACPIANFAEQRLNAHFVASVWRTGFRLPCSSPPTTSTSPAAVSFHPSHLARLVSRLVHHQPREDDAEVADIRARVSALSRLIRTSSSSSANLSLFVSDMRRRSSACSSKVLGCTYTST